MVGIPAMGLWEVLVARGPDAAWIAEPEADIEIQK
jgi:hypothetical protein